MKILVFSDTHGSFMHAIDIINNTDRVDAVIHCGDMLHDCIEIEKAIPEAIPFYYVCGNNDLSFDTPRDLSIELGGKKIFITHGHLYGVRRGTEMLKNKIYEGFDIVLYGHTHQKNIEYCKNGIILNPGSMSFYANNYAVIEIENGAVRAKLM
ncbi:MAG: metallophosphoesterase [Clostridia bacterium]|nr:metallophosphoesterase [Clostridia bacterium]